MKWQGAVIWLKNSVLLSEAGNFITAFPSIPFLFLLPSFFFVCLGLNGHNS